MNRLNIFSIFLILSFTACGEAYVKYDKTTSAEPGSIRAKSPTLLLSYSINKEYVLIIKDPENVKTYYKLSIDEPAPFVEAFNSSIGKNLGLAIQDNSILKKSKTVANLEATDEENLANLWSGPLLLKAKQTNLIPEILSETKSEQLLLARIHFRLEEEPKPSEKSKLIVSLAVLIYDKSGKLIFASEKTKANSTYLPDDDLSVANFMGDILMGALKGKINVRVNKHCRPILYAIVKDLWQDMSIDIKKKIN